MARETKSSQTNTEPPYYFTKTHRCTFFNILDFLYRHHLYGWFGTDENMDNFLKYKLVHVSCLSYILFMYRIYISVNKDNDDIFPDVFFASKCSMLYISAVNVALPSWQQRCQNRIGKCWLLSTEKLINSWEFLY